MNAAFLSRRRFLRDVLAASAAALGAPRAVPAETRPPNILLIFADDVGREVLGCYGGVSYQTPQLDALAENGVRFTHGYAMPVCHPSRICLLTGRYPFRLGNPSWGSFPKAEEKNTMAQVLKRAGYATAIAGKWQLTLLKEDPNHPQRLGFDESCLFGWHEGPRYHAPLIWQNGRIREDVAGRYGPDVYCEFLADFIKRHRDQPFFAFYSMALCHAVTDDLDEPAPFGPKGRYENYPEMVAAMDQRAGRMVAALERLGLRKNTLVLFIADNGTPKKNILTVADGKLVRVPVSSRYNGIEIPGGKGETTDWGTRVPWIANWPGVIKPGQTTEAMADLTDLLPTFAALAGSSPPGGVNLDGHNLAPVILGTGTGTRKWVFTERKKQRCVRGPRYRLYDGGPFFDAEADPFEKKPLNVKTLDKKAQNAHKQLGALFHTTLKP